MRVRVRMRNCVRVFSHLSVQFLCEFASSCVYACVFVFCSRLMYRPVKTIDYMTLWPSSLVRWPWNFTWIFFVKYLTIISYICVYKNFLVSEIFREQIYNTVLRAVPDDCTCLKHILVSVDSLDLNQQYFTKSLTPYFWKSVDLRKILSTTHERPTHDLSCGQNSDVFSQLWRRNCRKT